MKIDKLEFSSSASKLGRPRDFDEELALNEAMMCFWRHGYEGTSMSLLSYSMNMKPPSIYSAFGDKRALFTRVLHRYVGELSDIEEFLNSSTSAFDAVSEMLRQSAHRFTSEKNPRGCLLASSVASCSSDSEDVRILVSNLRSKIENLIRKRIEVDIARNLRSKKVSAEVLAALAIATIQGMSVLARDGASRKKVIQVAESSMLAWGT